MKARANIVFLYFELAEYSFACFAELLKKCYAVHVFRYPVNKEAPFVFANTPRLNVYDRTQFNHAKLLDEILRIRPDLIVCSGWTDKDYLKVCKEFFGKIPTVVAFDNQWKGTIRQWAACLVASKLLRSKFSHCWVPGERQKTFAKRLGFKSGDILLNFYSADLSFFANIYLHIHEIKVKKIPHRFIFVGRYYDFKGITDLWDAFIQLQDEWPNDWELWCLGTGTKHLMKHEKIKHFGFVQPKDLGNYMKDAGVFVLPSWKEPWGVVVHEFAAAGFPLLLSDEVGAADVFLKPGENGLVFKARDVNSLKNLMQKIILMKDEDLVKMGELSHRLATSISPGIWADTLLKLMHVRN